MPSSAPEADVPLELDDVCARATAADLGTRLATARSLGDAIQRFLDGDRDLARRRELAAGHTMRAKLSIGRATAESRAEAMRDLGRAIALDPENGEALAMLSSLLLEPPREFPAEARAAIEADRDATTRMASHAGMYAYSGFLVITIATKLLGVGGTWPFVVIGALLACLVVICAYGSKQPRFSSRLIAAYLAGHLSVLTLFVVVVGPLVIAPLAVLGSLGINLGLPSVYIPKRLLALHVLALIGPLALEWLGVLPPTYHVVGNELALSPWAIHLSPTAMFVLAISVMVMQMIAIVFINVSQRRSADRAHEQLHLYTWHLGQLVPTAKAAAGNAA